ncbi:serine--tRNA ligase [Patescibacteria group bacterium]|nr:serine--tRNA ligase [Patescibacteria group bacterium]
MIDINLIRKEKSRVREELRKRGLKPGIVDEILETDKEKRELASKIDELRAKQNAFSKEIGNVEDGKGKQQKLIEMKAVSERIKEFEPKLKEIKKRYKERMLEVPNISHPSVPKGLNENDSAVETTWGEQPLFEFEVLDHTTLGERLDLFEQKRAAALSGNRFYFLKNDLVRLEFALIQYLLDFLTKKGFTPLMVPVLVRDTVLEGSGFFPAEKNEIYAVNPDEDNLYLIGTSEASVAGYHMNEILDKKDLPKKYVAFSSCYRREAGAYGKDTKGLIRVHQFEKVEMFKITTEEDSWKEFEELVALAEEILQRLELHYQKVNLSLGDINHKAAKTYDLEAWFPSQNRFRELVSATNTTTFQSRRLNIRYKDEDNKKYFAHMMNSTAAAFPRILAAIMENYQNKDGTIGIPQVLQGYMSGQEKIEPTQKTK